MIVNLDRIEEDQNNYKKFGNPEQKIDAIKVLYATELLRKFVKNMDLPYEKQERL